MELNIFPVFAYTFLSCVTRKSKEMHGTNLYICLHLVVTSPRSYKSCVKECTNRDLVVLMEIKFFWDVTPCMILNFDNCLSVDMSLHSRRLQFSMYYLYIYSSSVMWPNWEISIMSNFEYLKYDLRFFSKISKALWLFLVLLDLEPVLF